MGCQLVTVQREEEPCILNATSAALSSVVGWSICQKNRSRFSISHSGLLLPHVSDPLYSEMPSKCDYEAKEEKGGEVMAHVRVSQAKCDAGCAHSHYSSGHEFFLEQEEKESRTGSMPRAHTDISPFPIISPLCHLTAGREATLKRDFIKPSKEEKKKTPECLLCSQAHKNIWLL